MIEPWDISDHIWQILDTAHDCSDVTGGDVTVPALKVPEE